MTSARLAFLVACLFAVGLLVVGSAGGDRVHRPGALTTRPPPSETPTATTPPNGTDTVVGTCPPYRGAALCEPTPPLTPTPTTETTATSPDDETAESPRDDDPDDWLSGLLPLLAWAGAVVVVAPLVLWGLVGLDSLRGGGSD